MWMFSLSVIYSILWLFAATFSGQTTPGQPEKKPTTKQLTLTETVKTNELVTDIIPPMHCDDGGNLYIKSDPYGVSGIHKLNAKGQSAGSFLPTVVTDERISMAYYFNLGVQGDVYQLAQGQSPRPFVIHFNGDGSYRGRIKLQTGFPWQPASLAVFPGSDNLLVAGQKYDEDRSAAKWPFTGIFSPDGTLLKEIKFEDDDAVHEMGVKSDSRVTNLRVPTINRALALSQMQAADDGNVYVMRWLSPAIFYAVSPGGEVVRRFEIDPGDQGYVPMAVHMSGQRIAVQFYQSQTKEMLLRVVDLRGNKVADYLIRRPKSADLRGEFACYLNAPERFVFLETSDDSKLEIKVAQPR